MNLLQTEITVSIILLAGTLFSGTLPAVIVRYLENKRRNQISHQREKNNASILSFLMCFGGGILLATCFVHMLPEVRHTFSKSTTNNMNSTLSNHDDDSSSFPMAEFVVCCGFFLIYLLEEIIHSCIDHSHHHSPQASLPQVTTCHHSRQNSFSAHDNHKNHVNQRLIPRRDNNGKVQDHCIGYGTTELCQNPDHATTADGNNHLDCEIHVETIINCETSVGVTSFFRSLMIVAALSFHSLFEGLAIGLSDTTTGIWQLLFAIAIHKFVISFAVGLEIYSETLNLKRVFVYILVFSLGSPLGIMTATIAKLQVTPIIDAIMNAIATGSILYIVFFEVLTKERHSPNLSGHFQLFGILCGFAVMVSLQIFTSHQH